MPYAALVFLLTTLMNTILPSSSETRIESFPLTWQPWITLFYCTEFPNYENLIKGMESLRYTWVGSNITIQLYSSIKPRAKTVPPFVKWKIKPACTILEELNSSLVIIPKIQSTTHLAMMKPSLYNALSWVLDIILVIQVVKPARKGSSGISVSLNTKDQKSQTTHLAFSLSD